MITCCAADIDSGALGCHEILKRCSMINLLEKDLIGPSPLSGSMVIPSAKKTFRASSERTPTVPKMSKENSSHALAPSTPAMVICSA